MDAAEIGVSDSSSLSLSGVENTNLLNQTRHESNGLAVYGKGACTEGSGRVARHHHLLALFVQSARFLFCSWGIVQAIMVSLLGLIVRRANRRGRVRQTGDWLNTAVLVLNANRGSVGD